MILMKQFHWVRDDIVIDFPIPKFLQNTLSEAEELDLNNSLEYHCVAENIDILAKNLYTGRVITKEQWDLLCEKYPFE